MSCWRRVPEGVNSSPSMGRRKLRPVRATRHSSCPPGPGWKTSITPGTCTTDMRQSPPVRSARASVPLRVAQASTATNIASSPPGRTEGSATELETDTHADLSLWSLVDDTRVAPPMPWWASPKPRCSRRHLASSFHPHGERPRAPGGLLWHRSRPPTVSIWSWNHQRAVCRSAASSRCSQAESH